MDKDKPWTDAPAYTQHLRPETLEQILKSRRVMPHEVGPLIAELKQLRALHTLSDKPQSLSDRIYQIAGLIHNEFEWSNTSQGPDYWHDVYRNLNELAEKLE
jgi:hypothetical protein